MTEKEKSLRVVVKKLARLLHKQYMGVRVKKIGCICRACIIEKEALADTEDTDVNTGGFIDVSFEGLSDNEPGRFVEVKDQTGRSINAGKWIEIPDGLWTLRVRCSPTIDTEDTGVPQAKFNSTTGMMEITGLNGSKTYYKWKNDTWIKTSQSKEPEDIGGEKCPTCGSKDKERRWPHKALSLARRGDYIYVDCDDSWHDSPPKEQDDEAIAEMWSIFKKQHKGITKWPYLCFEGGYDAACKYIASKGVSDGS